MTDEATITEADAPKKRGRPAKISEDGAPIFACEVLRDYWPTEDEADRVRTGAIVEVDAETAMDGIERGVLARVK